MTLLAAAIAVQRRTGRQTGTGTTFEITRTDAEWRGLLTEEQYLVLRQEETERAFTSTYLNEKRQGIYHCAGCDLALYDASNKFDSKTG